VRIAIIESANRYPRTRRVALVVNGAAFPEVLIVEAGRKWTGVIASPAREPIRKILDGG
jgi:hypothetical protein